MSKQTIVVTGATGYVASLVLPALREHYHLRLLDQRQTTAAGERIEEVQVVDLANPDRDTYRRHFQEADAVVHLAYNEPRTQTTFEVQRRNIDIAYNLAAYISQRDLQQLFLQSLTASPKALTREDGVPFQIFYGVSDNTRHFWSIANARQRIGYAPQDDSEVRFAEDIRRYLLATDSPEIIGRT